MKPNILTKLSIISLYSRLRKISIIQGLAIVFIVFAIMLAVVFFWEECNEFSLSSKVNHEKIGNYFTSIGAVAAAISIYFLFRQIKASDDARKATYQPDLYPGPGEFRVKDGSFPAMKGQQGDQVFVSRIENNTELLPYIEISNIGLGAAKHIEIKWVFNYKEISDLVKNRYLYLEDRDLDNENIDFLKANQKTEIKVPYSYLSCCGKAINPTFVEYLYARSSIVPKPRLDMVISYQSIGDDTCKKYYNVEVVAYDDKVTLKFYRDLNVSS